VTEKVKVRIDGEVIAATAGQTILEVARANNTYIPALCYMEGLSAVGACRLCMVEVSGVGRLQPACTTPVQEGLAVVTDSQQLQDYRKIALELLFCERNHICAVCVSNGHCELQSMAQRLGVTHVHLPYRYPDMDVDSSHDRFRLCEPSNSRVLSSSIAIDSMSSTPLFPSLILCTDPISSCPSAKE